MSRWDLPPDKTLESLTEEWLEDIRGQLDPETSGLYRLHMLTHVEPHFGVPQAITTARILDYGRMRLNRVKRETLKKERSTLRGFLSWCTERGYLLSPPEFPDLPKRAQGTEWHQPRRGKPTPLSPEECRALIARLPQWSRTRGNTPSFPIRARFIVAHETALRPGTLDALSVPEHYSRGEGSVRITDAIDKARFGRELPLSDAARQALDSVAPASGLIFGSHDYRHHLERAAQKALPPAKARTFAAYDLRHARLTEFGESGNLPGLAYLAGHKQVTTSNIYVRPGLRAAQRVLKSASVSPASRRRELAGVAHRFDIIPVCAKERTRTSTGVTPLAPQASVANRDGTHNLLSAEAVALLRAASEGRSVDRTRLVTFARAALESTELGSLALAVLDGGVFATRRAVELASLIAAEADASVPAIDALGRGDE